MSVTTRRTSKKGIGGFEYHPSKDGRVRWRIVSRELGGKRFRSGWCADAETAYKECLEVVENAKAQANLKYPFMTVHGQNVNDMYVHELLNIYAHQRVTYSIKAAGQKEYGTYQQQVNFAKRFKKFYPNIKVREVTAAHLYDWRQELEQQKTPEGKFYAKAGISKLLGFVRTAFEWAYDMKYIKSNVLGKHNFSARMYKYIFTRTEERKHIAAFTIEQLNYLLQLEALTPRKQPILDLRYKTLFKLQFITGLRISEALGLTWDKLEGSNLHISQQFQPENARMPESWKNITNYQETVGIKNQTKTYKERIIPLPESFLIELHEYRKWLSAAGASVFGNNVLFPSRSSADIQGRLPDGTFSERPVTRGQVNRRLVQAMIASKMFTDEEIYDDEKKLRTHSFRRGTGTTLADNGTDVHTISNILGHSNLHTLKVYVNPSTKRQHKLKAEALDVLASSVS
jgi:integrase|tara:strand:- start:7063 stop:8433 length:1371 start_codon:yes stop_codon:yes gene_type:complete